MNQLTNPERDQDRVEDLLDNWRKYGYLMFPQQRSIYENLANAFNGLSVLEAGCGVGTGTAVLSIVGGVSCILGTDKIPDNIKFARCLYPWLKFNVWDFTQPWQGLPYDAVVCVEAIEHVEDIHSALKNLIGAAKKEVWISTPNGEGREKPPSNPFHVRELTRVEFVETLGRVYYEVGRIEKLETYSWENLSTPLKLHETADPLVYRIKLRS